MMRAANVVAPALALLICGASGAARAQSERLTHDPFARPIATQEPAVTAGVARPRSAQPDWNPELRAVMLAGRASMVNVGGSVIRLGETVDGFVLTDVTHGTAVFVKDGKRYTLIMHDGAHSVLTAGDKP